MSTIKHYSIVNITDFCRQNFLKIAGTADFCQKMVILNFEQVDFPKNGRNMLEKRVFWHFFKILSLVFADFLQEDTYQECPKHGQV